MFGNSLVNENGISVANYLELFSDTRQLTLLSKSLGIASLAACLSAIFGVPLAFLIARTDLPGHEIWNWMHLLPLLIPSYVHSLTWISLIGNNGMLNGILPSTISLQTSFFCIYSLIGSSLILAFSYFPFVTLLTLSGFYSIDRRYEESASLNHVPAKTIAHITLPLAVPHIISGIVFVFIFSLFDYGVPALFRQHTYPVEIFAQFSAFYNEKRAISLALPLIATAIMLLIFQKRCMRSKCYVTMGTGSKPPLRMKLGRYKHAASLFAYSILFLTVFLPLATLLIKAEGPDSMLAAFRTSSKEISTSILVSILSATTIVTFGFLVSSTMECLKKTRRDFLNVLTFIPFAFPATVVGISLIYFWNNAFTEFIYKSCIILILAYIIRFIPFATRILEASFKQIAPTLKEAAMLSEKCWIKRTAAIDLPLSLSGIAAGWAIGFVLCMGELGATLLLVPPGKGTVALKIYTLMHYGSNKLVAALCLILILSNLLVTSTVFFFVREKTRSWRV